MGQNSSADWDAYQHCPASDALVTVSAMSRTMEALGSWMSSNRLRLNMYIYIYIYIYILQKTLEEHHAWDYLLIIFMFVIFQTVTDAVGLLNYRQSMNG